MSHVEAVRKRTVAGGAAGNLTVTGIKLGDTILHVIDSEGAGADLASEFTVTAADTVNNSGGTNTTGKDLVFEWRPYQNGRWTTDHLPLENSTRGRYPH